VETNTIIAGVALAGAAGSALYLALVLRAPKSSQDFKSLLGASSSIAASMNAPGVQRVGSVGKKQVDEEQLKRLKEEKGKHGRQKTKETFETKLFKAGVFSRSEQQRLRSMGPVLGVVLGVIAFVAFTFLTTIDMALGGTVIAALVGTRLPNMYLDRKIHERSEEILYYLPLVIEQIAIGVSSSLDIGPCLGVVVKMADERGSHNVVTELLKHVQFYVKSGASLEEALDEVGTASGQTELSHSFMSLAQVAKHGGEISKQMQELADAVSAMRETKVEERIKTLELKATGPVALVFVGFMMILIAGFFIQVKIGMAS
jgi:Flp pilus assembly protein TadB